MQKPTRGGHFGKFLDSDSGSQAQIMSLWMCLFNCLEQAMFDIRYQVLDRFFWRGTHDSALVCSGIKGAMDARAPSKAQLALIKFEDGMVNSCILCCST